MWVDKNRDDSSGFQINIMFGIKTLKQYNKVFLKHTLLKKSCSYVEGLLIVMNVIHLLLVSTNSYTQKKKNHLKHT